MSDFKERRNDRRKLGASALIRDSRQLRIGGQIVDISEWGCKIALDRGEATVGQMISIKLDGMESWDGIVRWVKDDVIGIELQRPLHSAIVDHLANSRAEVELT